VQGENYGTANDNDLIEMYGVPDIFCEGLARIDQLGPCSRDPAAHGRAVVAKLILPAEALADLAQMLAADIHIPKALASLSPNAPAN
jgi:hypothetical protein